MRPLQKMFNEVPDRYDFMNRLLTFRMDERWRRMAAKRCYAGNPSRILDLCTGTGDMAIHVARISNDHTEIMGLDYSEGMLSVASEKAARKGYHRIRFICGDAADLPFDNNSLDVTAIAFAFRNLTYKNPDREKFLKEIFRVITPGGRLIIVESSQPSSTILRFLFYLYLKWFVSALGGILSGHKNAYKYLAASARNFYTPAEIDGILREKGFREVHHKPLMGGIAGITVGIK